MGVLNFNSTIRQIPHRTGIEDIHALSLGAHYTFDNSTVNDASAPVEQSTPRIRRKRTKSGSNNPQYHFQDYGIDDRRRGSKHQRRKQNFNELQELAGSDNGSEEMALLETQMTVFAELLLDENKMKAWDRFIGLSEDKQGQYMEEIEDFHSNRLALKHNKRSDKLEHDGVEDEDEMSFLSIDKKIRDVLRSKQLAHDVNGLLQYYEDDVTSCLNDVSGPAVLVLDLEAAYDRMLVYAVCQYNKLHASTMKLATKTLVEVELHDDSPTQDQHERTLRGGSKLTEYLMTHSSTPRTH